MAVYWVLAVCKIIIQDEIVVIIAAVECRDESVVTNLRLHLLYVISSILHLLHLQSSHSWNL